MELAVLTDREKELLVKLLDSNMRVSKKIHGEFNSHTKAAKRIKDRHSEEMDLCELIKVKIKNSMSHYE